MARPSLSHFIRGLGMMARGCGDTAFSQGALVVEGDPPESPPLLVLGWEQGQSSHCPKTPNLQPPTPSPQPPACLSP